MIKRGKRPVLTIRGQRPVYQGALIPRADAIANRSRILDAAARILAERGSDAPVDEIARAAGVGAGTVHRHFPTKDELIQAVLEARLSELADEIAILSADTNPRTSFDSAVRALAAAGRHNLALTDALGGEMSLRPNDAGRRVASSLERLLDRARDAGVLRVEVTIRDLHSLLGGMLIAQQRLGAAHGGLGVEVLLAGLLEPPEAGREA